MLSHQSLGHTLQFIQVPGRISISPRMVTDDLKSLTEQLFKLKIRSGHVLRVTFAAPIRRYASQRLSLL